MSQLDFEQEVAAVRAFNRFYTRNLGVFDEELFKSPFSLSEARVLYELAHREEPAKEIGGELGLDAGYLSRIAQIRCTRTRHARAVAHRPPADRLALTAEARQAFASWTQDQQVVAAMLAGLATAGRQRLIDAMATIEQCSATSDAARSRRLLREPHPGDMGWVVQSHGALYAREHGYDSSFEGLVAASSPTSSTCSTRARALLDCGGGRQAGRVDISGAGTRRRREAAAAAGRARGARPGPRRAAGRRMHRVRAGPAAIGTPRCGPRASRAARKIYQDAGFKLVATEPHRSFGQDLIGETWELEL